MYESGSQAKPRYQVIKEFILEKIREGEYTPKQRIPTEAELGLMFSTSRITSKKALDELANEGIIVRKRKRGASSTRTRSGL